MNNVYCTFLLDSHDLAFKMHRPGFVRVCTSNKPRLGTVDCLTLPRNSPHLTPRSVNASTRRQAASYWPVHRCVLWRRNTLCAITKTTINLHRESMVNERPRQFGGVSRFTGPSRPGVAHPPSSATASLSGTPNQSRAKALGLDLGKGSGGLGKGKGKGLKRHMSVVCVGLQCEVG